MREMSTSVEFVRKQSFYGFHAILATILPPSIPPEVGDQAHEISTDIIIIELIKIFEISL